MRSCLALMLLASACVLAGCGSDGTANAAKPADKPSAGATETTLEAADGVKVFGQFFEAKSGGHKKVVLCFHQAGSSSWEYAKIAPKFVEKGFDVLAIDQRSGGDLFGYQNRTAAGAKGGKGYMDAYPDLEAALAWAKQKKYETILACGSSYSASLVIRLALDHGNDLAGILAFSPGEYFEDKRTPYIWTQRIDVPHLYAGTAEEAEESLKKLFFATEEHGDGKAKIVWIEGGVHGASALIPEKCKQSAFYWKNVDEWLAAVAP
ncbi:MAG: alpha/beta hydrolase [Armatimonadetes bacterium]|nr:alpha/beta hydrolase [Armatimonadota bacterium]